MFSNLSTWKTKNFTKTYKKVIEIDVEYRFFLFFEKNNQFNNP